MITPTEIKKKAERFYLPFLRAYVQEESFFPKTVPFGKVKASEDYLAIRKGVEQLLKGSKSHLGYGFLSLHPPRGQPRGIAPTIPAKRATARDCPYHSRQEGNREGLPLPLTPRGQP